MGTLGRIRPYKGIRIQLFTYVFFLLCLSIFRALELQRPSSHLLSTQATMSGSDGQGKWMVSSVKEEDITELRAAGYLAKEMAHRLPAEGQVVPTPEPTERVVFIPHSSAG